MVAFGPHLHDLETKSWVTESDTLGNAVQHRYAKLSRKFNVYLNFENSCFKTHDLDTSNWE